MLRKSDDRKGKSSLALTLQSVIERERSIAEDGGGGRIRETTLMNPVRRRIFELVCRTPCMTLAECARASGLSINNLKWHLNKLSASGYVSVRKFPGASVAVPAGLHTRELEDLLAFLHMRGGTGALAAIDEMPGSTAGEVAKITGMSGARVKKVIGGLEAFGIVTRVRDGRFVRIYPTGKTARLMKETLGRMKNFRAGLMKRFVSEGLRPEIVRADSTALIVSIVSGRERTVLNLHFGFQ